MKLAEVYSACEEITRFTGLIAIVIGTQIDPLIPFVGASFLKYVDDYGINQNPFKIGLAMDNYILAVPSK